MKFSEGTIFCRRCGACDWSHQHYDKEKHVMHFNYCNICGESEEAYNIVVTGDGVLWIPYC